MACRRAVVKLGGSAITVKSSPETVNWDALESLAAQLGDYVRSGGSLAVVHGGGSFGHYIVAKLLSERGALGPREVAETQREMLVLALAVINALTSRGIPATLHPAHTICGSPEACDLGPLVRDLEAGLVPVTYGDAVLVGSRGVIISGDALAPAIADRVGADCLIMASDVEGVIGVDGRLLPEVRPGDPIASLSGGGPDVTGGMAAKIRAAASSSASVVRIVRWTQVGAALRGEPVGTRVLRA